MESEDSNSCFEMFGSQGHKKSFESVPEDAVYKVKVLGNPKNKRIGYKLKEGTELPCDKEVEGLGFLVMKRIDNISYD